MARQSKYRPQQTVLRDAGCDMMELASETYEGLGAEDREKVDTICAELSASLVAKRGSKQTGLGGGWGAGVGIGAVFQCGVPGTVGG